MLVVSELSEALEDIRTGNIKIRVESSSIGSGKPHGLPIEIADAVIRLFDYCEWQGIDLEAAIRQKMDYNKTRPYMHGGKAI